MTGPSDLTIPAVLERAAVEFGPADAAVEGPRRLSFTHLHQASLDAARAVIASGVGPGDRVALWAPNSIEWIVASFAVYMAGAVLVPLNTRFKSHEAAYVVRTSGARLLLTVTDFLDTDFVGIAEAWDDVPSLLETVVLRGPGQSSAVDWPGWVVRGAEVDPNAVAERIGRLEANSTSDIIFTSGTTGAPKGAVLTHGASVRTYRTWADCVGLNRTDRYLVVYPFFHTAGLKSGVLACVLTGATIVPFPVFDVASVMECVAEQRISVLPGPPTVFQSILNHPDFSRFDLSSLRLSVTGAAVVPVEIVRRMREELRFQTVVTGYGLTETTGTVSMCRHDDPPETVATTVGRPLPGVAVKVVDESGAELPAGSAGELLVRGFNVMKEYFNDPAATRAAVDEEGWLRTGDIGYIGSDDNIRITDRKKDMYITGGFNVYPAEVEGIILRHPAIGQVALVGLPDERLGEVGRAVVVLRTGQPWDEHGFLRWCRDNMANYKVPRSVRVVDALPLNPSGKVMKFLLRETALRGTD
jgi:acyl-CoA synthetase (AMP-forming)/AMP-acid ligase II